MPSGRRTWRRRPLSGRWSTNPTTRGGGCSSWRRTWRGTRRGARLGSGGTSRCARPSRRRAGRRPMKRWTSRATGRASGLRSTSFRRATARCCYYGMRDYHTKRSPRRPDWRAARSARRSRGRAGGWCRLTKPESQVSMSHVDDGTLHTYLDGELAPAEARGVDAHVAQCPACRERLEEERALITRAGELLALAAPPDRDGLKGSPIGVDTARALLGGDPLAVPGAPIRAVYRARELGYSAVVIVEQVLDSNTVIEVVNRRRSPMALDQVVVTAAPAARADSVSAPERAVPSRARVADSLAAAPAERAAARLSRRFANLEIQISGPVSSDSLRKLLELVQPLKP